LQKDFSVGKTDALIIVDVQNDFCPGGALPVPKGDLVVPFLNDYIAIFRKTSAGLFATRDWHPPNHISFKTQGGMWPSHCVQNTQGAMFHPNLKLPRDAKIVSKAMDPLREAYSGFDGTELENMLRTQDATRIFVGGLATDYCVKKTVLDARKLGFEVVLLSDAIAVIEAQPGDAVKAVSEILRSGAEHATLTDFPYPLELPPASDLNYKSLDEKPLSKFETKKKARMRPRGPYKKIRTERG